MSPVTRTSAIFYLLCGLPLLVCAFVPPDWSWLAIVSQECASVHLGFAPELFRVALIAFLFPSMYFDRQVRFIPRSRQQAEIRLAADAIPSAQAERAYRYSCVVTFALALVSALLITSLRSSWDAASLSRLLLRLMVFSAALVLSLNPLLQSFAKKTGKRTQ